jgi:hypothetical protein
MAFEFDTPWGAVHNPDANRPGGDMATQDSDLKSMLRDLGRALSAAISDSPEVGRTLRRIRREGYSLQLLLDCKRDPGIADSAGSNGGACSLEPSFRIDARDLSFLRSIGIDPTRRLRRRSR